MVKFYFFAITAILRKLADFILQFESRHVLRIKGQYLIKFKTRLDVILTVKKVPGLGKMLFKMVIRGYPWICQRSQCQLNACGLHWPGFLQRSYGIIK